MAFNWEKGLLGAGLGALSGYDYMLKSKMKEEYETRMEEARAQRQQNFEIQKEKRLQAYEKDPNSPQFQERQLRMKLAEKEDLRSENKFNLDKEKFEQDKIDSQRDYSLRAAQVAASIKASNRSEEESRLRIEALKDPTKRQIEANQKIADYVYKESIKAGASPAQAATDRAIAIHYGVTELDQLQKIGGGDSGAAKDRRDFVGREVSQASKFIETLDDKTAKEEAFKITQTRIDNPEVAKTILIQNAAVRATSAYDEIVSGKSGSPSSTDTEALKKKVAMENKAVSIASKYANAGYDSLSDQEAKELEGIRQGYKEDKFSAEAKKRLRPLLFKAEVTEEKKIRDRNKPKEFDINSAY